MKLKAGIIGVGSIGAFIDTPSSKNIASHTKAYESCENTDLVAICEPDNSNIEKFKKTWNKNLKIFKNPKEFFDLNLDIVSITSPTKFHFKQLQMCLNTKTKYILCEKPIVANLKELYEIKELILKTNKKILINIIRDFNPYILNLKKDIEAKRWGEILTFEAVCTKGLLHNGIHLISLISKIIGSICEIEPLSYQYKDNDINGDFIVKTSTLTGHIKSIKNLDYSEFLLTIWLEKGKIEITTNQITCYKKISSSKFKGYSTLKKEFIHKNILKEYALDSLGYLLTCNNHKDILKEHIDNHEIIFKTIQKVQNETSN